MAPVESRNGSYLDKARTEKGLIQDHGIANRGWVSKFNIGISFRLASPLVTQDGDTVNCPA